MNRRHSLLVSLLMLFVVLLALTGSAQGASASTGIQGAVGCSTRVTFSYDGFGEGLEAWSGAAAAQDPQALLWQLTPAALAAAKYGPGVGKAIYAQRDRAWKAALVSGRVLVTVASSVVTDARMCVTGYGAGNAYGRVIACAMTAANFVPVGGTAFRGFRALAVLKGMPKSLRAIRAPKAAFEAAEGAADDGATLYRAVGPSELADLQKVGRYRAAAGQVEGKHFFATPEETSNFARMMGDKPYTTTSVRVSSSDLAKAERVPLAREGEAYFFRTPVIPSGRVTIYNHSVVP